LRGEREERGVVNPFSSQKKRSKGGDKKVPVDRTKGEVKEGLGGILAGGGSGKRGNSGIRKAKNSEIWIGEKGKGSMRLEDRIKKGD